MKNERTLRIAEDAGPFIASVSFRFNKQTGEWDIPHSVFIEGRGRSGTELDNWLNELGVKHVKNTSRQKVRIGHEHMLGLQILGVCSA